jgi:predicted SAM-dependent methyltransferase
VGGGTPSSVRRSYWKLRYWQRRLVRHAREAVERQLEARAFERDVATRTAKAFARMRAERSLLLNIGASGSHLPGWVSLDLLPDERGIRLDVRDPWPLIDGSAAAIRSEHMIEHLSYAEAHHYFDEAFRVLEPGGVCRTCTPDLEGIVAEYRRRDPAILELHREHGYAAPTWAHFVNNYFRLWGHRFIFDAEALEAILDEVGFVDVERTPFGVSRYPRLAGTDSHDMGALSSVVLCVDARKPER